VTEEHRALAPICQRIFQSPFGFQQERSIRLGDTMRQRLESEQLAESSVAGGGRGMRVARQEARLGDQRIVALLFGDEKCSNRGHDQTDE